MHLRKHPAMRLIWQGHVRLAIVTGEAGPSRWLYEVIERPLRAGICERCCLYPVRPETTPRSERKNRFPNEVETDCRPPLSEIPLYAC